MKTATIILNRNLPEVTDRLCDRLNEIEGKWNDVFVVEAGSEPDRLSRNCTWHADWEEAKRDGLRLCRGFNFGLLKLIEAGVFKSYDAFFLVTNDTEFASEPIVQPLYQEMIKHPRLGLIAPCSERWGEKHLLREQPTKFFWHVQTAATLMRREYIEALMNITAPTFQNLLFDGDNFRGFHAETELVAKGYANNWAAGITSVAWANENENHLLKKSDLIKTDSFEENMRLYVEEGLRWMREKYGFHSRWQMQLYAKFWYDKFFEFNPEFAEFKI